MKHFFHLSALSGGLTLLSQGAIIEIYPFTVNTAIPDGNPAGLANVQEITSSSIVSIDNIAVTLDIAGTYNGDLYLTLQHSSGFAVLLNRVGRDGGNAFGYDNDGFDITLNDFGGFPDVHTQDSGGGLLTGTFGSDGRTTDPGSVVTGDPSSALLTSFNGLEANGSWVLFAVDLSNGDTSTLNGWTLEITGVIPEPGSTSLLLISSLALMARRKR